MKKVLVILGSILLLGSVCVLQACKDKNTLLPGESPSTVVFPPNKVSFGQQVQPLFSQACAIPACHDDATHAGGLSLTSYWNTVYAVPGIIVSKDPANSILIMKIEGRGPAGERMPPTANALDQNQIDGLRTWIAEGAQNN